MQTDKKRRWDVTESEQTKKVKSEWDEEEKVSTSSRWDTPDRKLDAPKNNWEETPSRNSSETPGRKNRWDETPDRSGKGGSIEDTPAKKSRSRWDETPQVSSGNGGATPSGNY